MKNSTLLVLTALLVLHFDLIVAGQQTEVAPTESATTLLEQIQGEWKIQSATINGQAVAAMKGGTAKIEKDSISITVGGNTMKSQMTIDEFTSPIRVDTQSEQGEAGRAIMKLDGKVLSVCAVLTPTADYPKGFAAAADSNCMLIEYVRGEE